jgi:2-polyprenyl-6-hydroxyphenyl methylase/3-demethylubiquinone-9 3-methyltransferase
MADVERYYDEYWRRDSPPPCADPLTPTRIELLRAVLPARSRVLDAGCGAGDLVALLASDGHEAIGMDVSEEAIALAAARHPDCRFLRHSAEELPWPVEAGSFDAVVSFEVVEHLLQPRRLLEGARAALRGGGGLALTTPYHGLVKNVALVTLAFDRHFAVEGDHVRFFSDRALRRLLAGTGFEVVRVEHFGRCRWLWAGTFAWSVKAGGA